MKIVISGASGFIGSHLVNQLIDEHELLVISRSKTDFKCESIHSDLNNIEQLTGDHDVFIHAAGQAHVQQNSQTRELFIKNNINATKSALKLALQADVKHFILISSIAALSNDNQDIYARTKRESELLTVDFCKFHNIHYTTIRPVMVYGENDVKGNMNKLIKQLRKGFFPLFNNGKTIKNMIYIKNLTFIIKSVMLNNYYYDRSINVRDKETMTMKSICQEINKEINKKVVLIPIPRFACLLFIRTIGFIQMLGFLKSLNKESVSKLLIDVNIDSENFDLPYSSREALRSTVRQTM